MARRRFTLDTKQRHHLCLRSELLHELRAIEIRQTLPAVAVDEIVTQGRALAPGRLLGLVGLCLRFAHGCTWRNFRRMEIPNSKLAQPFLEPRTVRECVFGAAHSPPPANIAECIHTGTLQRP